MAWHWNRLALLALGAWAVGVGPAKAELREFYIITVHYDGVTNLKGDAMHKPEAFPATPFASKPGVRADGRSGA